jgi:hypothetical protein
VGSHPVESLPGEQSLTLFERLEESGHFNKRLFEGAYVEPREAGPKRVFELAGIGWFELGGNPAGEILIQKFCRLGVADPLITAHNGVLENPLSARGGQGSLDRLCSSTDWKRSFFSIATMSSPTNSPIRMFRNSASNASCLTIS